MQRNDQNRKAPRNRNTRFYDGHAQARANHERSCCTAHHVTYISLINHFVVVVAVPSGEQAHLLDALHHIYVVMVRKLSPFAVLVLERSTEQGTWIERCHSSLTSTALDVQQHQQTILVHSDSSTLVRSSLPPLFRQPMGITRYHNG